MPNRANVEGAPRRLSSDAQPEPILGPVGRTTISWSLAGGPLLVLLFLLTGAAPHLLGGTSISFVAGLALLGTLIGMLHGGALALLGRPEGSKVVPCAKCVAKCVALGPVAAAFGVVVASWLSLSPFMPVLENPFARLLVAVSWIGAFALGLWAFWEGVRALSAAHRRLPGYPAVPLGLVALFLVGAVGLSAQFPGRPEELPDLSAVGGVLVAGMGTVWVGLPLLAAAAWIGRLFLPDRCHVGFEDGSSAERRSDAPR
ncbi:MAG TPA: hypothetical protein VK858_21905 [Longimicrobiales bacterium]|nr:hypothetical protein [Longimicrobiales bacterium]